MGNICSSSKNESEAFDRPGRVLGSGTATSSNAAPRAPVPTNWKSGRTLGSQSAESGPGGQDARTNAALAAQKRAEAKSNASKGKLGSQLAAQKAQTQTQTLMEASREERTVRDADNAATMRWD